jgi:capsular exopolysaccharide synthesis family protein
VIDADLRRSDCHKILGIENGKGLAEALTGGGEVKEMISPTATDNLFLLSSGTTPPNPTELVGSNKIHEILTSLQEHYDYIFIDSPPVIPLSDAVLLSPRVDGVVMIVKGNETPRSIVKEAHQHLSYARAKFLGVVLNCVIRQGGDSAYYYDHYYSSDQPPFLPIKELLQDYDEYYRRVYLNNHKVGTEKT